MLSITYFLAFFIIIAFYDIIALKYVSNSIFSSKTSIIFVLLMIFPKTLTVI